MLVITRPLTKGIPCAPGEFREIPQEIVRRLTNTEKWTKAMNKMNRHTTLTMTLAYLWLGIVLLAGKAVGQQAGSILKHLEEPIGRNLDARLKLHRSRGWQQDRHVWTQSKRHPYARWRWPLILAGDGLWPS